MAALSQNWRKSSYSTSNGSCVQVRAIGGSVQVADTKQDGDPARPILSFAQAEWAAFVAGVKDGQFT